MSSPKWALVTAQNLASAVALLVATSAAMAQNAPPVAPDQALSGAVDVRLSRVYARIGKLGWDHEHAAEGRLLSGNAQLGASERAGELVFDAASFLADTQDARRAFDLPGTVHASIREKITRQIFSRGVLDADHFPQAVFRIRSALPAGAPRADGGGEYRLDGELALHGVNRPLRIVVLVEPINDRWRVRGECKIKLGEFDIHPPEHKLGKPAGSLDIEGDLWLQR